MLNFNFCSPTNLVFGRDTQKQAGALSREHLGECVMLHYGGSFARSSGLLEQVTGSLLAAGLQVVPFGGAQPNPLLSLCLEGIRLCRDKKVTGILALGGGSVIDSAKCIAMGVPYDGDPWDFYMGKAVTEALPVGTILTIPAAGSELSQNTVVTNDVLNIKRGAGSPHLRPRFSILNPELCASLPPYQTACGISDICAHVLERYFTPTENVEATDRLCEAVLGAMIAEGPKNMADPADYEARANVMFLGAIAHNGLLNAGRQDDWGTHGMGHELTALYGVAHGATLSILFPAWMRHAVKRDVNRFARFARRVMEIYDIEDTEALAMEGINRYEAFLRSLGLPTRMSEAGITDNRVDEMVERLLKFGPKGCFLPLDPETAKSIYTAAL